PVGRRFHRAGETPPLRDDGFSRVVDDARGAGAGGAPVARATLADAVAAAGGARAGPGPARGARVRRPSAGVLRRVVRRPGARAAHGARGRGPALGPDEARRAARPAPPAARAAARRRGDRKSTRLNSSHGSISYAVFCLKKKKKTQADCKRSLCTY